MVQISTSFNNFRQDGYENEQLNICEKKGNKAYPISDIINKFFIYGECNRMVSLIIRFSTEGIRIQHKGKEKN